MNPLIADHRYSLSILKDPFAVKRITGVHLHWFMTIMGDKPHISGSVEFKNGQTEGKQHFEAADFDDLLLQVKSFLESLPK